MFRISTQMIYQRAVTAMLNKQSDLSHTQLQLSTGKRVITAADDPTSAARVLRLNTAIDSVKQYQSNADRAQARLETEEAALFSVTNVLQRSSELAIQGNNDALTDSDRSALAKELRQLQQELFGLANTKDSNGEYIFAGYQSNDRPFSYATGVYSYNGDLGNRLVQISPDNQVADGNNGYEVFMNVATGQVATVNGAAAANWNTAITAGDITIDGGNGAGPVALGPIPAATSAAERATQIRDAVNAVTSQTNVTAVNDTATTVQLTAIGGTGITIALSGTGSTATTGLPVGATAAVSGKQNILTTLDQLASELEQGNPVDRQIADIQAALQNIINIHTSVGGRLNAISEQGEVNKDVQLVLESHRSDEQDLDYTEAISRFESQKLALEAAQKAYVQVQGLSLFNYL